jgi:hypothetical protein
MAHINEMNKTITGVEAVKIVKDHVSGIIDARHLVRLESDDSGKHIVLYIERSKPGDPLPPLVKESLSVLVEHYWNLITIKVPIGMVEIIISGSLR